MIHQKNLSGRKDDHIDINLNNDVSSLLSTGLERYHLLHCALPQMKLSDVDLSINLFNKHLRFPLLISSMTGGTSKAAIINRRLASVAQDCQIAMGVGSQRIGINDESSMDTFRVRKVAPDILLFANLGAGQLNYGFSINECRFAVDSIEANGLILHLNPLQESLMQDGNTDFSDLLRKIEIICNLLEVPVVIKEVGWGISEKVAGQLFSAGVSAVDVSGAGGTSWSEVERHRTENKIIRETAGAFKDWGLQTAEAVSSIKNAFPQKIIFASGGLTNGVDIIKVIALGTDLGGMAGFFFRAAAESEKTLRFKTEIVLNQMRIATFSVGAKNIQELRDGKIIRVP